MHSKKTTERYYYGDDDEPSSMPHILSQFSHFVIIFNINGKIQLNNKCMSFSFISLPRVWTAANTANVAIAHHKLCNFPCVFK